MFELVIRRRRVTAKRSALFLTILSLSFGPAARAEDGGVIRGTVKWTAKKIPKQRVLSTSGDKICEKMHANSPLLSEKIVVNANKTVQNVFVYIKSGLPAGREWKTPEETITVDQKGCRYEPHVFGIMTGQQLIIHNGDKTLHNVNCNPKNNPGFNTAQPQQGMKKKWKFPNREIMIKLKCDSHSWMSAYAGVMEHPFFAVTDEQGRFEIAGLPPGDYVLATWHEHKRLKPLEREITLAADETKEGVDFSYPPKK